MLHGWCAHASFLVKYTASSARNGYVLGICVANCPDAYSCLLHHCSLLSPWKEVVRLHVMVRLHILLPQVKKWTATQRKWSIWSMFMAVSNFAAAPTGGSLITKFFKQPPSTIEAQVQQQGATSAQNDRLLPEQGLPEEALINEGQQDAALKATEPLEGARDAVLADKQHSNGGSGAPADKQMPQDHRVMMAGATAAHTSQSVLGLQEHALARTPLSAALPPSVAGGSSGAWQIQPTASQQEPSALQQATASLASPQGSIVQGVDLVQSPSSCPLPSMPNVGQNSHCETQDNGAADAACRQDPSGASDQPVHPQAAQTHTFGDSFPAQGPVQRGSAKRPLEQAFAKEPEHRKKPARCGKLGE